MTIQLALKIIEKIIQEMQKQSAADLEAVTNMARLQHDYRQSQLDNLIKLCDHSLRLQENGNGSSHLEPK